MACSEKMRTPSLHYLRKIRKIRGYKIIRLIEQPMIPPSWIELRLIRCKGKIRLFEVAAFRCISRQFFIIGKLQSNRQRFFRIYIQIFDAEVELVTSAIKVLFHLIQKSLVVGVVNSRIKNIDKTILMHQCSHLLAIILPSHGVSEVASQINLRDSQVRRTCNALQQGFTQHILKDSNGRLLGEVLE